MGRTLKRVPLDFDWPIHEIWSGYINPHHVECSACRGRGETYGMQWLETLVRLILLAGEESTRPGYSPLHPYLTAVVGRPTQRPSTDLQALADGLSGRPASMGMHDAIDANTAVRKIVTAAGLDVEQWGLCPECRGSGIAPEHEAAWDAWEPTEPPEGPGFQLWDTTGEGSPLSPVFPTLDALCAWAEKHATTFASWRASAAEWKQMLEDGTVYHKEGSNIFL